MLTGEGPEPPVNARLEFPGGVVYPLELVYDGQDKNGNFIWLAVRNPSLQDLRHSRISVDVLPANTAIAFMLKSD